MYIFSPQNLRSSLTPSRFKFPHFNWKWKKLLKIFLWLTVAGFVIVAGVFLWIAKDLPSPSNINERFMAQSTKIYDRTGNHLLYEIHGEEKRTQIPYSEMPEVIRYATIAMEDQGFYSHRGIKLSSILRAAGIDILSGQKAQGGSTITQQLIKNSLLSSERTLTRKIKEAILALELETKFSKDEILEMYLNEIPYGSNAYGVEAAAQTFFNCHSKDLSLPQAALIASLPKAPTYYSPYGSHLEDLKARQELILNKMANFGYITPDQAGEAKKADILSQLNPYRGKIEAPHFVMYIKEYLEKKYGGLAMEQGGLKVYTTLDWDKQQMAEQVVRDQSATGLKYSANNSALVAMDPKTGQILAMVGSRDYFGKPTPDGCTPGKNCKFEGNYNVTTAMRQPGSSFKPYTYLTAFEKGYTPETMLWDADTNFSTDSGKDYTPKDYDGKNRGPVQMKNALAMSLNIPAVETLYLAGVKNSIQTAQKMGITTLTNPDRLGLSLVLGGGEVTLMDHVNAFSTLATGGIKHSKVAILKIEDSSGNIMEQYQPDAGGRVIDEKYVAMIDYILSTNDLRAPIFGNNSPLRFDNRPVAAKTGTTNEWRDGWTIGYTPSLAAGVWAGNNDNSTMAQGADGVFVAAPIWRAFMDKALQNYSVEQFPKYEKEDTGKDVLDGKIEATQKLKVCKIPGKKDSYCLASDACPDNAVEEKKFSEAHSILHYIDKDDPRGDAPENPENDPQYKNWEKAVRDWAEDNKDYSHDPPPTDECSSKDFKDVKPSISITSPSNGSAITSSPLSISASADSPFAIKKISLSVNGNEVSASANSSISYNYNVPADKKTSSLEIKATIIDRNDNSDSDKITVQANIP